MIAIVDYGAGNLFSVKNALDFLKVESAVMARPEELRKADGIILPGVGAFPDAMGKLRQSGLAPVIIEESAKKPLLGICLGMQLLFERSYEFVETEGLGLLPGKVVKIDAGNDKIPHMGWNDLTICNPCPLTSGTKDGDYVYFVHSFRADTDDETISCYTSYHEKIPALVHREMVYGAQFHPEKSGKTGMGMLQNFAKLVNG